MYHPILRPGAQRQIKKVGEADLVIGLPSHKNALTAARVAEMALRGAQEYYPHLRTVLINADAGLKATTRQAVGANTSLEGITSPVITGRYSGLLGCGSAVAALLDAALALDARAIIVLDSYNQAITPRWVAGLADLILSDKADLVMPRYQWSLPEGALSDLIAYPLFRALWGQSLRHPAAPEFGLSAQMAAALLDEDIWETEVAGFGLPPWLATYAVLGNWRVAQSALGYKQTTPPKLAKSQTGWDKMPRLEAGDAQFMARFHNVVSVLLRMADTYQDDWLVVSQFQSLPTLTEFVSEFEPQVILEQDPTVLLDNLALGWIEFRGLWQRILTPENLAQIEGLAALPADRFYFPSDLWTRIVYDIVVAFNKSDYDPYQIVQSIYPLYQGRLAAFWQEIAGLSLVGREGTVAAQAVEFEEARSYLKKRWSNDRQEPDNKIW